MLLYTVAAAHAQTSDPLPPSAPAAPTEAAPSALPTTALPPALPADRPVVDWARRDMRANTLGTVAQWSALGGASLVVLSTEMPELTALDELGMLTVYVGTPIAAGAGLRARTALNRQGADVNGGGGITGWALWGSSIGLNVLASLAYTEGYLTDDAYVGAVVTADLLAFGSLLPTGLQLVSNAGGRRRVAASR